MWIVCVHSAAVKILGETGNSQKARIVRPQSRACARRAPFGIRAKPCRAGARKVKRIWEYPRRDSNPRAWLRRPELYPLSYGGASPTQTIPIRAALGKRPAGNYVYNSPCRASGFSFGRSRRSQTLDIRPPGEYDYAAFVRCRSVRRIIYVRMSSVRNGTG